MGPPESTVRPGRHHQTRMTQPSALLEGGTVSLVLRREEGQGLAEYALILSLIAILAIAALLFFSGQLDSMLSLIGSKV
jgi:Flp pilus assembly pilin Flp